MSRGIGAEARLVEHTADYLIYEYGNFDLNSHIKEKQYVHYDGMFKIPLTDEGNPISIKQLITQNDFCFQNCSNTWMKTEDIVMDVMIIRLLMKIEREYRENRQIPENMGWFV